MLQGIPRVQLGQAAVQRQAGRMPSQRLGARFGRIFRRPPSALPVDGDPRPADLADRAGGLPDPGRAVRQPRQGEDEFQAAHQQFQEVHAVQDHRKVRQRSQRDEHEGPRVHDRGDDGRVGQRGSGVHRLLCLALRRQSP